MNIRKLLCSVIITIPLATFAQTSIKEIFVNAPFDVIPTIASSTRMDMIDYFEHGMNRPSKTYFGDDVVLTELAENSITAQTSTNFSTRIVMLPTKGGTLLMAIDTFKVPEADSRVRVFDGEWKLIALLTPGTISQWLTPLGLQKDNIREVENKLEFITAAADYDNATGMITFSNTSEHRLMPEEYNSIRPFVKDERQFQFNGKTFKEIQSKR